MLDILSYHDLGFADKNFAKDQSISWNILKNHFHITGLYIFNIEKYESKCVIFIRFS